MTESTRTPIRIDTLRFRGGAEVDCKDADTVVIVGPNNSGKSQTLADIQGLVTNQELKGVCVKAIDADKASQEEMNIWLRGRFEVVENDRGQEMILIPSHERGVAMSTALARWGQAQLNELQNVIVQRLDTSGRLGLISQPDRPDPRSESQTYNPIYEYMTSVEVKRTIDNAIKLAFEKVLIADSWGRNVVLRIADKTPAFSPKTDVDRSGNPSSAYLDRLERCEPVGSQGDGIKSFVGCLLALTAGNQPIQLFDEPEAFLHPPQAKLLGREIGGRKDKTRQIFVATHSSDVLSGILDASRGRRVKIIRITRSNSDTAVADIDPSSIEALWNNATLRYSKAVEGLFHDGVIVSEAPTDCYFYEATVDGMKSEGLLSSDADYVFASSNGKDGIVPLGKALDKLGVPWSAIADIDVVGSKPVIDALSASRHIGEDQHRKIEDLRSAIDTSVRSTGTPPAIDTVRRKIDKVIAAANEDQLTPELRKKIRDTMGVEGGWGDVKRSGRSGMKPAAREKFDKLVELLDEHGLVVLVEGELELLADTIAKKGGEWLREALEVDAHLKGPARLVVKRAVSAVQRSPLIDS